MLLRIGIEGLPFLLARAFEAPVVTDFGIYGGSDIGVRRLNCGSSTRVLACNNIETVLFAYADREDTEGQRYVFIDKNSEMAS